MGNLPSDLFTPLLSLDSCPEWMNTEQLLTDIEEQLGEDAVNWLAEQLNGQTLLEEVYVPDLLQEIQEKLAQTCKYAEEASEAQAGEAYEHPTNSAKQENSDMIQAAAARHPVESVSRTTPSVFPFDLFSPLLSLHSWPEWMSTERLLSDIKAQLGEDAKNWLAEQLGGQILPAEVNVVNLLKEISELVQSCEYAEEATASEVQADNDVRDHPGDSEKQENSDVIQAAAIHPVESASYQLGEDIIKDDEFKVVHHI